MTGTATIQPLSTEEYVDALLSTVRGITVEGSTSVLDA